MEACSDPVRSSWIEGHLLYNQQASLSNKRNPDCVISLCFFLFDCGGFVYTTTLYYLPFLGLECGMWEKWNVDQQTLDLRISCR